MGTWQPPAFPPPTRAPRIFPLHLMWALRSCHRRLPQLRREYPRGEEPFPWDSDPAAERCALRTVACRGDVAPRSPHGAGVSERGAVPGAGGGRGMTSADWGWCLPDWPRRFHPPAPCPLTGREPLPGAPVLASGLRPQLLCECSSEQRNKPVPFPLSDSMLTQAKRRGFGKAHQSVSPGSPPKRGTQPGLQYNPFLPTASLFGPARSTGDLTFQP